MFPHQEWILKFKVWVLEGHLAMSWRHFDCHTLEIHVTGSLKGRLCNISVYGTALSLHYLAPNISKSRNSGFLWRQKRERKETLTRRWSSVMCRTVVRKGPSVCCWMLAASFLICKGQWTQKLTSGWKVHVSATWDQFHSLILFQLLHKCIKWNFSQSKARSEAEYSIWNISV